MTSRTYVVTGATGAVGRVVVARLKAQGHHVRPVARSAGVSLDDATALARAFSGVDGAFLMIPFAMKAPDLHQREDAIGRRLADAVTAAGVRRVVFLSGTSAHLKERAGSGRGAAMMEERLDGLGLAELVHVRGSFFMENFLNLGIIAQAQTGTFGTMFRPDLATPMVATQDVGEKAAELLTEEPFRQPRVRELLGSRDYTMAEATRILGAAIGKSELKYLQIPYEEARGHMLGMGLSPSFVDAVTDTARSFNEGIVWVRERRSAQNTTPTTLEQFAEEVFRKAYEATMAG
jgi:uncharacterized protein YbjT (DUF2867 family)